MSCSVLSDPNHSGALTEIYNLSTYQIIGYLCANHLYTYKICYQNNHAISVDDFDSGLIYCKMHSFTNDSISILTDRLSTLPSIIGAIIMWSKSSPPDNYLICDGSAISRVTYSALYNIIGSTFGPGDGSTTFNLPDMRGLFVRGYDGSANRDPDKLSRTALQSGGNTGNSIGSYQLDDQFKVHSHSVTGTTSSDGAHTHTATLPLGASQAITLGLPVSNVPSVTSTSYTTASAGAHTHTFSTTSGSVGGNETRPKNISLLYCIKYI